MHASKNAHLSKLREIQADFVKGIAPGSTPSGSSADTSGGAAASGVDAAAATAGEVGEAGVPGANAGGKCRGCINSAAAAATTAAAATDRVDAPAVAAGAAAALQFFDESRPGSNIRAPPGSF